MKKISAPAMLATEKARAAIEEELAEPPKVIRSKKVLTKLKPLEEKPKKVKEESKKVKEKVKEKEEHKKVKGALTKKHIKEFMALNELRISAVALDSLVEKATEKDLLSLVDITTARKFTGKGELKSQYRGGRKITVGLPDVEGAYNCNK